MNIYETDISISTLHIRKPRFRQHSYSATEPGFEPDLVQISSSSLKGVNPKSYNSLTFMREAPTCVDGINLLENYLQGYLPINTLSISSK